LKPDDPDVTERHLDEKNGTVDLTLRVHEKGKNSVGLTGGVSGLAGSFIGLSYSTNNFLGLGETLSVSANIGNRQRNIQFGFTEPYLFDRPLQLGFTVYTNRFQFDQAQQAEILTGQRLNLPSPILQNLQNYTQSSTGFSVSLSYPIRRSLKRVGLSYSYDRSSLIALSTASQTLFTNLAFRGLTGPNSLNGIVTSKIVPSYSKSTIDSPISPHTGTSMFLASEIAGLGGTVQSVRPIFEYKHFIPVQKRRNTIGLHMQASFLTGYGGLVAPPFERFYLGGENDLRGFDIRSVSPVAFLPDKGTINLTNPDGSVVPRDPGNPLRGNYSIPIPVERIVFPGGDTSIVTNAEYRITIAGPVALAPFMDFGVNPIIRNSQLRINSGQLADINNTAFGCPALDFALNCVGGQFTTFNGLLKPVGRTNWIPRMSTGLELQVFLPIVNAPFRIYWAYNPLRLDTTASSPVPITRSMFPPGAAGDYTFLNAVTVFSPNFQLREPRKTFRFTVATTF
jgi:outer membrane protein insertion porin family